MATAGRNYKGDLVVFLQRYIGRTLTKDDVQYTVLSHGDQFQVTAKLVCHNGEEFVSDICTTEKEAGQAAAAQALAAFAAEVAALPPSLSRTVKQRERRKVKQGQQQQQQQPPPPQQQQQQQQQQRRQAAPTPTPRARLALLADASGEPVEGQAGGLGQEDANHKTRLVQALQLHCRRAMTRGDVVYEIVQVGDMFQATVRLESAGGLAFVGECCTGARAAEHSAAQQALLSREGWPAGAPAAPQQAQKRKIPEATNPKSELVIFLQGYVKRTLTKADITYSHNQGDGLIQATVTLACLDGQQFAGEPCATAKAAELSAAQQALLAYSSQLAAVPALRRIADRPQQLQLMGMSPPGLAKRLRGAEAVISAPYLGVTPQPRGGGLGVYGGPRPFAGVAAAAPGGAIHPLRAAAPGVRGLLAARRAPVPAGPRIPVVEGPVLGDVVDWNALGAWGYLRPHAPIEHPLARLREGKIYVHKQDLANAEALEPGGLVQFRVYEDSRGLGASDVLLF